MCYNESIKTIVVFYVKKIKFLSIFWWQFKNSLLYFFLLRDGMNYKISGLNFLHFPISKKEKSDDKTVSQQ